MTKPIWLLLACSLGLAACGAPTRTQPQTPPDAGAALADTDLPVDQETYPTGNTYRVQDLSDLDIVGITSDSAVSSLPAAQLADGDLSTPWVNGGYRNPTAWAAVQLAQVQTLTAVAIKTGASPAGTSYDIQVSNDGNAWTTVLANQTNATWGLEVKTLPAGTTAGYVRIFWHNSTSSPQPHFAIWEMAVRGTPLAGGGGGATPTPAPTPSAPASGPSSTPAPTGGTYPQYYPDIAAVPAMHFYFTKDGSGHTLLRFESTIANLGPGRFQVSGHTEGTVTRATQEILDPSGNIVQTQDAGTFAFHPAHHHFHLGDLARYELHTGGPTGPSLFTAPKVSFCAADSVTYGASSATSFYNSCTPTLQGISPNYADVYPGALADQYFDVTGLGAGYYYYVLYVDPSAKLLDARRDDNVAWTRIYMDPNGGRVYPVSWSTLP